MFAVSGRPVILFSWYFVSGFLLTYSVADRTKDRANKPPGYKFRKTTLPILQLNRKSYKIAKQINHSEADSTIVRMEKSNQQKINIMLSFGIVFAAISLSQGLPFPGEANHEPGAKRQGVYYGYPSSPSEPYTSEQANTYASDPAAPSQQDTYQSSDANSFDNTQTMSSYASEANSQQSTPSDQQSAYSNQQSAYSDQQSNYSEPQSTSSQEQSSYSNQQTTYPDQNSYAYNQSSTTQATSSTDYADTQGYTTDRNATEAAQSTQSQTQTPDNTTQSQASSYYTGNDVTGQTTAANSGSQFPGNNGSSQVYDVNQNSATSDQTQYNANPYQTDNNAQANQDAYQENKTSSSYSNPQQNPPGNVHYELVNVTSKTVPNNQAEPYQANSSSPATVNLPSSSLSALGLGTNNTAGYDATIRQGKNNSTSPVTLSASESASIADSVSPNGAKKYPSVSKETTVTGNHATTYLELPKNLHKPAIVKYQVQVAPKTKGVPIDQEIAIMPPEGTVAERKPLVLLKQTVSKPTDERIQIIVPKDDSSLVNKPKVEVKGGHVDQEDVDRLGEDQNVAEQQAADQGQVQGQDQGQGQTQYQGQSQGQGQTQYQGQSQGQGQTQYQGQGQSQSQEQNAAQGQVESEDFACRDLAACSRYNPTICDQKWMRRHCKNMCGLCSSQEPSFSPSPSSDDSSHFSPKHCEYGGVVHQSGETWSPGPCVPRCQCENGVTNCSKVECPDLNCNKPVKRRWKCCPECLPNLANETGCGVETRGGNGENLCCVFPFNYRGVDYFTCTTAESSEPWCAITRNYDRDGLWGNCVVKNKVDDKHTKQHDSDEKSALVLATQLSSARRWRNSTNNQVTEALKSLPNPLSQKTSDQLSKANSAAAYHDASTTTQNTSMSYNESWNPSGQYFDSASTWNNSEKYDDSASNGTFWNTYYNQYDDTENVSNISGLGDLLMSNTTHPSPAFEDNSTSPLTSSSTSIDQQQISPNSSSTLSATSYDQRQDYSSPVSQGNTTSQPTLSTTSYDQQQGYPGYSSRENSTSSPPSYSQQASPGVPAQDNSRPVSTSYDQQQVHPSPASQENSTSGVMSFSTSYDQQRISSEPSRSFNAQSTPSSYLDQSTNKLQAPAYNAASSSETVGTSSDIRAPTTGDTRYSPSSEEAYQSAVGSYANNTSQESTATDTSDNVVPNGIENQTSYEMNPNASTAQYGSNQTRTT